jgi:hypothetical protein
MAVARLAEFIGGPMECITRLAGLALGPQRIPDADVGVQSVAIKVSSLTEFVGSFICLILKKEELAN